MAHWLMKSEPGTYSWDDLVRDGGTEWDGVRNNAARLHLRAMKPGDEALFYHSGDERAVVGIMRDRRRRRARRRGRQLGQGPGRAGAGAGQAGDAGGDQGRAEARQDGADPPVAAVGAPVRDEEWTAGAGDGRAGLDRQSNVAFEHRCLQLRRLSLLPQLGGVGDPIAEGPAVRAFAARNRARDADELGAHLIGRQSDLRIAVSSQIDELEVRREIRVGQRPARSGRSSLHIRGTNGRRASAAC